MTAKILVVGATGINKQELVKHLTSMGVSVLALVCNLDKICSLAFEHVEVVEGDFSQPNSLNKAMEGIDKAYITTTFAPYAVEMMPTRLSIKLT